MYMDKDRISGLRQISCAALAALFFCFMLPCNGIAQGTEEKPIGDYSADGLLTAALDELKKGDYVKPVPFLEEYIRRMSTNEDYRVQALVQDVRLKLGTIHFYNGTYLGASTVLDAYLKNSPIYRWRQANKYSALSLFKRAEINRKARKINVQEDYQRCFTAATNALFTAPPENDVKKEKTVKAAKAPKQIYSDRQKKRFKAFEDKARVKIVEKFDDTPSEEPEYTEDELVLLYMTMGEASARLDPPKWDVCTNAYAYVIEHTESEEEKGYAMMKMVEALIAQKKFDEAQAFVLKLYRTNARYNIRVNSALMVAAQALYDAERYDGAAMLFRMILPREELVDYQLQKMDQICLSSGLPRYVMIIKTNETGRIQTTFGNRELMEREVVGVEAGAGFENESFGGVPPPEVADIQEMIILIQGVASYENEVVFRLGLSFGKAGRPWEAVEFLQMAEDRDPDGEMGHRALYEKLSLLVDPLKEYDWVERDCLAFLNANTEGLLPRQLAYILSGSYQYQEHWEDIKKLMPYLKGFQPFIPENENQRAVFNDIELYESEIYFMQAVADLMLIQYEAAERAFAEFLVNYPKSKHVENAFFWHAMTLLFQQRYSEALVRFEEYSDKYPSLSKEDPEAWAAREEHRVEAFFRGGVCLYSTEEYSRSKERFTFIIENHPNVDFFSDACSLRGDILAGETNAQGNAVSFDAAVKDYRTAISSAVRVGQATYAVFQLAALLEMNASVKQEYLTEIVNIVTAYLNKYGENADVAKAAHWIGKIKIAQGRRVEAVAMYLDTVVKYGGAVKQDGVDSILIDLVKNAIALDAADLKAFKIRLKDELNKAGGEALKLRLRVLIAKIDRTERELGKLLLAEQKDLSQAPPPVLALICEASFETGNYSRSAEILKIFQTSFDESEFVLSAYKLRAFDLFAAKDEDGAMKIIQEVETLFPKDPDAGWAQVMKGRILLSWKQYADARETLENVLKERDWRGVAYAQAAFYLGAVAEAEAKFILAFQWYQRVYVQYKGYEKGVWAAEGYLACARCLQNLGLADKRREIYRDMLFNKYVNTLPQADTARKELGSAEVAEINAAIAAGVQTNITVSVEAEVGK